MEQQNVSRYEYKVLQLYVKIFALEISAPLRQSLKHDSFNDNESTFKGHPRTLSVVKSECTEGYSK